MLGMTATPARTDGFHVFEFFDHNVPYEIRLNALEAELLCPFHYYGVTDVEFDDGTTTSNQTTLRQLASMSDPGRGESSNHPPVTVATARKPRGKRFTADRLYYVVHGVHNLWTGRTQRAD
jgi:superfamily II DNA or RNA helicase